MALHTHLPNLLAAATLAVASSAVADGAAGAKPDFAAISGLYQIEDGRHRAISDLVKQMPRHDRLRISFEAFPPRFGGLAVEIFAPGVVSTPGAVEYYPAFSPDGRQVWFTRATAFAVDARRTIYTSERTEDGWHTPLPASFSGAWNDSEPFVSPDGQYLFFSSDRPAPGKPHGDFDLWVIALTGGAAQEPRHLDAPVNSATPEHSPVVTRDGTLYFRSSRTGGLGSGDFYRAGQAGGRYTEVENLGRPVNSRHGEWNCVVHPGRGFILFESSGRPTNVSPRGDLYVSRRGVGGGWSTPLPLARLNTAASELAPRLSPDGVWLYFSTSRASENVDIYRVRLEDALPAHVGGDRH